jgi:hypothetical protein
MAVVVTVSPLLAGTPHWQTTVENSRCRRDVTSSHDVEALEYDSSGAVHTIMYNCKCKNLLRDVTPGLFAAVIPFPATATAWSKPAHTRAIAIVRST